MAAGRQDELSYDLIDRSIVNIIVHNYAVVNIECKILFLSRANMAVRLYSAD